MGSATTLWMAADGPFFNRQLSAGQSARMVHFNSAFYTRSFIRAKPPAGSVVPASRATRSSAGSAAGQRGKRNGRLPQSAGLWRRSRRHFPAVPASHGRLRRRNGSESRGPVRAARRQPPGRLIANAWARWTKDYEREPEKLAGDIGQLKLKRADPLNDLETSFGVISGEKKKFQGIRHKSWEDATALIVRAAQEQ